MKITPIGSEEIYGTTISRNNFSDFPWAAGDDTLYVLIFEDTPAASDYCFHLVFDREPTGVSNYIISENNG